MTPSDDDILSELDFTVDEPDLVTFKDLSKEDEKDVADVILSGRMFDLTQLTDIELATVRSDVRERLLGTGEMHRPADQRTEDGKTLHSVFLALQIEFQNRRPKSR